MQTSPGVISDEIDSNTTSEGSQSQSFTIEPIEVQTETESHHSSQELLHGPEQSNQIHFKTKSEPSEGLSPAVFDAKELTAPSGLSTAQLAGVSFSGTTSVKRTVGSGGFYLEAKVNGEKMVFSIDAGATKTIISERVYKPIPSANRPS